MRRSISDSEIRALLTCQAQHDFRYVGQLAGTALKPKTDAPRLRAGRAWGQAMAVLHAQHDSLDGPLQAAHIIHDALEEDAEQQRATGVYLEEDHVEQRRVLVAALDHYAATTDRLPVTNPEHELDVAIPSRTGRRASNAYRLLCKLDGLHIDAQGRLWIVEYKWRDRLTAFEQITLSRQIRWYAWAWQRTTGQPVTGVIVDERLNEAPKPARIVNAKRKGEGIDGKTVSHAVDQMTTPDLYRQACAEYRVEPSEDTLSALAGRRWQSRQDVMFRQGELDEAGRQLVSAARQVAAFDSGVLFPVRNPSPATCGGCAFREICPNPQDVELVDALFKRVPAKRDRLPDHQEEAIAA